MSKVEHPKAPIKTTLTLKYSNISVRIEMANAYEQVRGFEIAGEILKGCQPAIPKITYNKSVICPECNQESTLSMVDNIGVECPHCHTKLAGEIEI